VAPPGLPPVPLTAAADGADEARIGVVVVVVAVLTVVVMVVVEAVLGDVVDTTPPDGGSDRGTPKENAVSHAVG